MADEELPRPDSNTPPGWETELARALGYTFGEHLGERIPDGTAPTAWNLIVHPFAFLEQTHEIIAWEIEGEPGPDGIRRAQIDPTRPDELLLRPVRYPIPDGFEILTLTDPDGSQHVIALGKPST